MPARHDKQIEWRNLRERFSWSQNQPSDVLDRRSLLPDDMESRIGNPRQDFERTRQVNLIHPWKNDRANVEVLLQCDVRHASLLVAMLLVLVPAMGQPFTKQCLGSISCVKGGHSRSSFRLDRKT